MLETLTHDNGSKDEKEIKPVWEVVCHWFDSVLL